jgi:hypothetical protein
MSEIVIGRGDQGDVRLDVARLIESQMLIQATTGGGKTSTLRRILEQSHGMVQQLVIDPEGEFYTLREKFDYIIAGKGGDCAADPRSAKLLAKRLLELGVSAICDLSELKMHDRIRFVRLFCEALIEAPRSKRVPALVVIDEAHLFCPEKGQAESAAAVIDLSARGRKRQLTPLLATQRLAKLNKDAAAQLGNVLIGRTGLDIDQVRAADVLGFAKAERIALRDLKWREFYAFGPAFAFNGVQRLLVGDTATKNPKMGQDLTPPPPPTAKMRELLAKVADLPAEAEAEARTLDELKRDLADTRRRLTIAEKRVETPPILSAPCDHPKEIGELRARIEVEVQARETFRHHYAQAEERLKAVAEVLGQPFTRLPEIVKTPVPVSAPQVRAEKRNREQSAPKTMPAAIPSRHSQNGAGDLEGITGGAMRMLVRLAERHPETWTRAQLATLAKIKRSGGTFGTYLSRLNQRGLIAERDGRVSITDDGLDLMGGPPAQPQTHEELVASWRERLTGGAVRMFDALLDAGPDGLSREELADAAEITLSGGTYGTYLSRLVTNGLAERQGDRVVATALLQRAAV